MPATAPTIHVASRPSCSGLKPDATTGTSSTRPSAARRARRLRSGSRAQDEVDRDARVPLALEDRAEEQRAELPIVVGDVDVRLAEHRRDRRRLEAVLAERVGHHAAAVTRLALAATGRVQPDLDARVADRLAVRVEDGPGDQEALAEVRHEGRVR